MCLNFKLNVTLAYNHNRTINHKTELVLQYNPLEYIVKVINVLRSLYRKLNNEIGLKLNHYCISYPFGHMFRRNWSKHKTFERRVSSFNPLIRASFSAKHAAKKIRPSFLWLLVDFNADLSSWNVSSVIEMAVRYQV